MTFSPKAKPEARQKAISALIQELNGDTKPIMLGPWRGELGFEALYWTPFLRFLASRVKDFDKRAAIITRGGLASVYGQIACQGYDLYALRTVTEVRRANVSDQRDNGIQKQVTETEFDASVLRDAARQLKIEAGYHVLPPALMYWALSPFWEEERGLKYLASMTDFAPFGKLTLDGIPLPPHFVAVKFYGRHTFPYPHPDVVDYVKHTVSVLASQAQVVVLSSGAEFDDHMDIALAGPNIHLLPAVPPEQNLLIQAAVLSQAQAFVGTYGGMAQLALRLGVPSVSVWLAFAGTAAAHLTLSNQIAGAMQVPFVTGSLRDTTLWRDTTSVHSPLPKEVAA